MAKNKKRKQAEKRKKKKTNKKQEQNKETENACRCSVCLEEYEEGDIWIECESYSLWYHTDCVDIFG